MAKTKLITAARPAAAKVISDVIRHHRSLNGVLRTALLSLPDGERSLCQQLCYGVIRWQPQLQAITEQLLSKSLKNKDSDIQALLLCGLYQLRAMRLPEHAALSETVNGCAALGKPWAKGLINASLRNYQRNQSDIDSKVLANDAAKFAHPDWLIQTIKQDWPEQWQQVLEANNQQPPMFLRVNQQQHSQQQYLGLLIENDIPASEVKQSSEAILLNSPCDVYQLPGFETGAASVQDAAAQQVAAILQIGPKQRILDACAAPGGKTCHILETEPSSKTLTV